MERQHCPPEFYQTTVGELDATAAKLLGRYPSNRIWCLQGPLGSGKTTLIKSFCKALGFTGSVSSPTFNLMHEYQAPSHHLLHFDLYRLTPPELPSIGLEHYLAAGNYCFIEWPEIAQPLLEPPYLWISLSYGHKQDSRAITATYYATTTRIKK